MYSSDLKRAIDTAHLIQDTNEVSVPSKMKKLPAFREVFFGSFGTALNSLCPRH